jgi:23S rRNA-/tRNA-specific pseudouridylate synthase
MESIFEIVIRIFIYKLVNIWREWVPAVGGKQVTKSLNLPPLNEVEILYRSRHFLVINKKHDIVINSDDPTVKVCHLLKNTTV